MRDLFDEMPMPRHLAIDDIIERMANGEDVLGEGDNQSINNKRMGYTVAGLLGFIAGVLSVEIIILGVMLG